MVGAMVHGEDWVEVAPDILYSDRSNGELNKILETARRMREFPLSVELGLGRGYAGHGVGVLIHRRIDTSQGSRFYLGAGLGRLSGRRFIGSSMEFDRDLSELVLAFEASAYINPEPRVRITPAAHGHVGAGGVALGITFGVAFGG